MNARTPFLCMGICRFFGMVGFCASGWPVFHVAQVHWDITFDRLDELTKVGSAGIAVLTGAVVAGLLGLVIGQFLGMGIRVRDNASALRINVLWHCLANGGMLWLANCSVLASVAITDKEMIRAFAIEHGTKFFLSSVCVGLVGAATIGVFVGDLLVRRPHRDGAAEKLMLVLPFGVGIPLGVIEALLWGFPAIGGAVVGFLYPLLVTTLASGMWERDQAMRMRPNPQPP